MISPFTDTKFSSSDISKIGKYVYFVYYHNSLEMYNSLNGIKVYLYNNWRIMMIMF